MYHLSLNELPHYLVKFECLIVQSINQSLIFNLAKMTYSHYEVHGSVVQRCQMRMSGNDC